MIPLSSMSRDKEYARKQEKREIVGFFLKSVEELLLKEFKSETSESDPNFKITGRRMIIQKMEGDESPSICVQNLISIKGVPLHQDYQDTVDFSNKPKDD
jgi:hypothetical protein